MYKVELKFDTSKLAPETVNQMCEQADQIFEQEDFCLLYTSTVVPVRF